jgi:hypothetical protein
MDKHLELSNDSRIAKVAECLFVVGTLSIIIYAFIRSCKPISNQLSSQVLYWAFVSLLISLWIIALDDVLRMRRFEVRSGVIEEYDSRLLLFRFRVLYTGEQVSKIEIDRKSSHFLFKQRYDLVIALNTLKRIRVKSFGTEKEASDMCARITELLRERASGSIG